MNMHRSFVFAIAVFTLAEPVTQLKPTGYVNDFAHVLSADTVAKLNGLAQQVASRGSTQPASVLQKVYPAALG